MQMKPTKLTLVRNPFPNVARFIAKGEARWLASALSELATNVTTDIHNAEFVPLRKDVRADIKRLQTATKRFEHALDEVSKRLLELPVVESECLPNVRVAVGSVAALCE